MSRGLPTLGEMAASGGARGRQRIPPDPNRRPPPGRAPVSPAVEGTGQRPPTLVLAALASAIEAVALLGYAVLIVVDGLRDRGAASLGDVTGLVAVTALVGFGVAVTALGLWRVRRRAVAVAAVAHALAVLVGLSFPAAGWSIRAPLVVIGAAGLAALFTPATREALGTGRLPGR